MNPEIIRTEPTKREFESAIGPISAEAATRPYYRMRVKEAKLAYKRANPGKRMVVIANNRLP